MRRASRDSGVQMITQTNVLQTQARGMVTQLKRTAHAIPDTGEIVLGIGKKAPNILVTSIHGMNVKVWDTQFGSTLHSSGVNA